MIVVFRGHSERLLAVVTCDSPNQLKNVKVLGTFHRFDRNAGDVEVNVPVVRRKVKLIRFITTFEMTIFLHCVLFFLSIRLP